MTPRIRLLPVGALDVGANLFLMPRPGFSQGVENTLLANQSLSMGQSLVSANGAYRATYRVDGRP